ncbi:hypothetical protein AE1304_35540 [Aeromonas enteropelogenes]
MQGFKSLKKGEQMEELLRSYFIKAGYYVVRGVPFCYKGFDVTDIDLWVYGRVSSVSREITIVDVKNKRTPQAIERIFWAKGLQIAVGATSAIVATTDYRAEVKDFGREQGIFVLDGSFMSKLSRSESVLSNRITEEELFGMVNEYSLAKLDGDWKGRLIDCKKQLLKGLSFDSCNLWLEHGRFFANQYLSKSGHSEFILRALYIICSYIAIAIDYMYKEMSFMDEPEKEKLLRSGFKYGSRGEKGKNEIINASMSLVQQYAENGTSISNQVKKNIDIAFDSVPSEILSRFFSMSDAGKTIFQAARELERLGMTRDFIHHSQSSVEVRALLGCLLDYWGLDRASFT